MREEEKMEELIKVLNEIDAHIGIIWLTILAGFVAVLVIR